MENGRAVGVCEACEKHHGLVKAGSTQAQRTSYELEMNVCTVDHNLGNERMCDRESENIHVTQTQAPSLPDRVGCAN